MSIPKDSIGTRLVLVVKSKRIVDREVQITALDISAASSMSIFLTKPGSATPLTKTGLLLNTGTDGKMYFATTAGDLDTVGPYVIEGTVAFAGGSSFPTTKEQFEVE